MNVHLIIFRQCNDGHLVIFNPVDCVICFILAIIHEDSEGVEMSQTSDAMMRGRSLDSIPSTFTNGSSSPGPNSKY